MVEKNDKAEALAKALDGKVFDDSGRVQVSVKAEVLGFPVTVEAIRTHFPFPTNYYVNIDVLKEGAQDPNAMTVMITPKMTKGLWNRLGRLLLIDAHLRPIGDPQFDNVLNMQSNNFDLALRFVRYPMMTDRIKELQNQTGFTELHARATAGLLLVQPTSFDSINLDVARETVRMLGDMAQVLFDVF
ncbi:MAG: hypothetical protein JSS86_07285 [Cyanobacteria bacterium SZAS LIN-2]|nr:hypothetical protein [Cyanobacteria bacterium SZAS LIN-3]MBS1996095.1 hypothetical protein [Cyanobacteria bacterium SZAS LIN-2]MBS2009990.1 hypothetical protein [Cyanobacteria bacterium SZAS TMP-1]